MEPTKKLKIKVCGMRETVNIRQLGLLRPDMMGFIFYPGSPRYVDRPILNLPEIAGDAIRTGVFVDSTVDKLRQQMEQFGLQALQLHGSESPAYCEQMRTTTPLLIKAISVSIATNWDALKAYRDAVDFFLFDTKSERHGGTGQRFDWELLQRYELEIPYFLSGGIGPETIGKVLQLANADPRLGGVDLNSRFEHSPGLKNISLLTEAFKTIRQTP